MRHVFNSSAWRVDLSGSANVGRVAEEFDRQEGPDALIGQPTHADNQESLSNLCHTQNDTSTEPAGPVSNTSRRKAFRWRVHHVNTRVFSTLHRYLRCTPLCSRAKYDIRKNGLAFAQLDEHRGRSDIMAVLRWVDVEACVYKQDKGAIAAAVAVDSLVSNGSHFTLDVLDKECQPLRMVRGRYLGVGGNGIVFEASTAHSGELDSLALKLLFLDRTFLQSPQSDISKALAVSKRMEMRIRLLLRSVTSAQLYFRDRFAVPLFCGRIRGLPDLFDIGSRGAGCSIVVLYKRLYCSLADLLSACASLSYQARLFLTKQMIEVVHNLHCKGLVHRDIKDSNFFLDEQGNIYLGDFGLSVPNGSTEALVYTPKLTDPSDVGIVLAGWDRRRAIFAQVTEAADLWALGMTLYKLWTGVYPFGLSSKHFRRTKDVTMYIQQLSEDKSLPDLFRQRRDAGGQQVHPEVQRIIRGLLCFDRTQRLRLSEVVRTSQVLS
ncbi:rhoptry kinase family protein ROP41 [Toxoplasma gondii ME49]|uniref:Rhoptry kinase family protein ROP41 n=4 Tax=Toxoplasma gondii TaxID=5811 RepID=A0A086LJZ0_TOXGO|nr:rhoptry kinase family protein ROP41 [Toxoplasma gondii ME49]EPT27685.1 rhoptry kinase family protein ROP41 [Toxoplasma gondii ME49]KFG32897.1 rhoptry kinase family protein ROP41 [Toxoplasma gondii p89]KFG56958.1 rhoptry kinase family protein ROP41 [Toxoplasma gondii RUB]KFH01518.1 rhoptry kinase family protein ROP41 [Toxoplasma gondii VAND]|eukprot:XP_002368709.1 rhoptry kinase family protein ROP41 [Toxoplasma gondii ME49]